MKRQITETREKPWLKQPGELHDKRGVPIYPGDLLRSFHFRGARRKIYYLYHTVIYKHGAMLMVPTCHLEPTKADGGGECLMDEGLASNCEVIAGCGPKPYLDYTDRPKRKVTHA